MTKAARCLIVLLLFSGCATIKGIKTRNSFDEGVALFNQGRFEAAIPHFQDATREDPNFAPAYFYLGRSYISLSRWRAAIQPLRAAVRLAPDEAKGEIMTVLTDAIFAVAVNEFKWGDDAGRLPERLPAPRSGELL
ncbi:MAG TPA: tetratricopeptide repeat protein [Candidatus Binatia bacterium]|nr:tetratricopeptide repeat protein [Candidatus Binatia bacterium]